MAELGQVDKDQRTYFVVEFDGVSSSLMNDMSPVEIVLGESLLTPGLQTSVLAHSYLHNLPIKILDEFKVSNIKIKVERPVLSQRFNLPDTMLIDQKIYRVDNRKLINNTNESFYIHACDRSLLDDAATLVSKYWKCDTPSSVVNDVLSTCLGIRNLEVEPSDPARPYMAENIRPFQVVNQQANVALANGTDPSFIHYMTYENLGTHKFRSLYNLVRQSPTMEYWFQEVGAEAGYAYPYSILTHSFPCDFDLLSDILNGVEAGGTDLSTLFTFNPLLKSFNMFDNSTYGCGIGSGLPKMSVSNEGSAEQQNSCPDYSKYYIHKRQARMGLLEQDKIALRMVVPWVPHLNAGKIIRLNLPNKTDPTQLNYGSGDYLIVSLKHHIRSGGYSTITMDCVSKTVGIGVV